MDLYLLHWPECQRDVTWMDCSQADSGNWRTAYRALERLYASGRARAIGVSNFNARLLQELLEFAVVPPMVVQNWQDVTHHDFQVVDECQERGIIYQAYSPLHRLATVSNEPRVIICLLLLICVISINLE